MFATTSTISLHADQVEEIVAVDAERLSIGVPLLYRVNAAEATQHLLRRSLQSTGYNELREVRPLVLSDCVKLYGSVSSFFLKQLAQEAVRPHMGGRRILNHVQVFSDPNERSSYTSRNRSSSQRLGLS